MISPTVGRVVWYRPSENDNRVAMAVRQPRRFAETGETESAQPLAALVTYVFGDREVNLVIFDHDGSSYGRQHVQLVQEGDEIPSGSYCQWMPYQVGQAKKHEAPAAQIVDPGATHPSIDVGALEQSLAAKVEHAFSAVKDTLHARLEAIAAELNHQTLTRIDQLSKGLQSPQTNPANTGNGQSPAA